MRSIMLFIILATTAANAQLPTYYVDLVKGDVSVRRSKKPAEKVGTRSYLFANDIISLNSDGAEVTLLDNASHYTVLNKKGNYSISQLAKIPFRKASGITEKYFALVIKELSNPANGVKAGLKDMVTNWGGVERGSCHWGLHPFDSWVSKDDSIVFQWHPMQDATQYSIYFRGSDNEPLLQLGVRDTQVVIYRGGLANAENTSINWRVQANSGNCDEQPFNTLTWLSPEEYDRRTKDIIDAIPNDGSRKYNLEVAEKLLAGNYYTLAEQYLMRLEE